MAASDEYVNFYSTRRVVSQTRAVATRSQPPKPASLRDVGVAAPCGGAGMWLLLRPCVAL